MKYMLNVRVCACARVFMHLYVYSTVHKLPKIFWKEGDYLIANFSGSVGRRTKMKKKANESGDKMC